MRAFHNSTSIKDAKVLQLRGHQAADEIIKGRYWENGKGCAVGCTVHSGNHAAYETEMGIPRMLARLEDRIFEGMPNASAKLFPLRFIEAIPVGADLSRVSWQFLHWLVIDVVARHGTDAVKAGAEGAIEILRKKAEGEPIPEADALAARSAALKARAAAAFYAADAAAFYAADAAAFYAAAAAADAAAAAAADAAAFYAADARSKAFDRQAEKLIELLAQAPVPEMEVAA